MHWLIPCLGYFGGSHGNIPCSTMCFPEKRWDSVLNKKWLHWLHVQDMSRSELSSNNDRIERSKALALRWQWAAMLARSKVFLKQLWRAWLIKIYQGINQQKLGLILFARVPKVWFWNLVDIIISHQKLDLAPISFWTGLHTYSNSSCCI